MRGSLFRCAALVVAILAPVSASLAQTPLTTAFRYQGAIRDAGVPATGLYDLRFRLYDAATGGTQIGPTLCSDDLAISEGLLNVLLDFGPAFSGQARWLEIEVRADSGTGCLDDSGFTTLSPRQDLTATPHAQHALSAGTAQSAASALTAGSAATATNALNIGGQPASNVALLSGNQTFSGQVSFTNPSNIFSGAFSGNGSGLTALNGGNITAGTITRDRVAPDIESVLSQWTPQAAGPRVFDAAPAWGLNLQGVTDVPALPPGLTYTQVAAGYANALALRSDGSVVGWGENGFGQSNVPALPPGLTYTQVAASNHNLALRSDGTVVAWGRNDYGQTNVPSLPPGVFYTAVSAGWTHCLALRSDGTAVGWGNNEAGQANVPALPPGLTYTAMSAGGTFSLALRSDGSVVAWGRSSEGQTNVPTLPPGLSYTRIAAGGQHALAMRSDGSVVGWGANGFGQTNVPALPPGVIYSAVSAGWTHCLALRSDGTAVGWGRNDSGEANVPALPPGSIYSAVAAGSTHSQAIRLTPPGPPSLTTSRGLSIGAGPLPSGSGLGVAGNAQFTGNGQFSGAVIGASFNGSGAGLTNLNAASLTGTIPASTLNGVSGAGLTGVNAAQLAGQPGSFYTNAANLSGTLPAATLSGVSGAGLTGVNAAQLAGQPGSFYTNAANLTGTLADARLSTNIARYNTTSSPFSGAFLGAPPSVGTWVGRDTANNASIQLTGGASPYLDFAYNPFVDFDARIMLEAGSTLALQASNVRVVGNFINNSDARDKHSIRTLESPLDTLARLRGVRYFWNDATITGEPLPKNEQIGFLAQEVEKVLPEAVVTFESGQKGVSYISVVPLAVEAIKALKAENEAARAENEALRRRLERLESLLGVPNN